MFCQLPRPKSHGRTPRHDRRLLHGCRSRRQGDEVRRAQSCTRWRQRGSPSRWSTTCGTFTGLHRPSPRRTDAPTSRSLILVAATGLPWATRGGCAARIIAARASAHYTGRTSDRPPGNRAQRASLNTSSQRHPHAMGFLCVLERVFLTPRTRGVCGAEAHPPRPDLRLLSRLNLETKADVSTTSLYKKF